MAGGGEQAQRELVVQRGAVRGQARAQMRRARKDAWSKDDVRIFIEALVETLNVSEAARTAGKSRAGAYARRLRYPEFAKAWDRAIDIGYSELEAALLRDLLFGGEVEELTLDGEGAIKVRKIKRGRDQRVALAMLDRWHDKVARTRQGATGRGPDTPSNVARLKKALAELREKRAMMGT